MWKEYSIGFIKRNKASGLSVFVAAFISALFLSLLCCLFFQFWCYERERIVLDEGDWQGRIMGNFDGNVVSTIRNFANVEKAVINEGLSDNKNIVIDIYFQNMRTIYRDMPVIAEKLELTDDAVSYHELLLSRYLIH
ncbi:MAG: ABC transporter permease, partial [Eubacterium sp.]|nr:ABC transporter permease [Eubacterium sp.]